MPENETRIALLAAAVHVVMAIAVAQLTVVAVAEALRVVTAAVEDALRFPLDQVIKSVF